MRISIAAFVLAGALMMGAIARAADQPADPVSVLKSGASFLEKEAACRTLSTRPSPEAVPVLAGLLTDEKLSHMARYALEPMLYPEAGQALRDALGKTSGRLRVGVINSLAIRKDEQAVPELLKLLPGESEVARAVAVALGVIATPEAEKALSDAIAQAPISQGRLNALCDGLLGCAERHALKGEKDQAIAIYDRLLQIANTSSQVQIGALRGAVLTRGAEQGLPLLVERLRGENADAFVAALRVSRELGSNRNLAAALAGVLPNLPPERKVRILDVFSDKDGEAAGEAVLALANDGPVDVRVAALRALTRMGYTPALKLVSQLAWAEDEDLAEAARDSLAYGYGKDGDAALEALLQSDQTKARRVAVELIGRGGLDSPVALLMKVAGADADEAVRVAALDGLHDRAGIEELAGLLDTVVKGRSAPELKAAESTLAALCERQKQMPGAIVIQKAVYGDLTPGAPSADVLAQVSRMVSGGAPSIEATNANFGEPAPGVVKQLRVDYTENGAPISKTVKEGETLKFTVGAAPATLVDAFCGAFAQAQGEPKLSMLRLLGTTGSQKAFDIVRTASSGEGAIKETALRTLCEWPTPDALPVLMELAKTSPDEGMKVLALRGAVRLLGQSAASPAENLERYSALMGQARTPEEKKVVLSGLAQVPHTGALELAFAQFGDPSVKPEAVQAAIAIGKNFGASATEDKSFFNGSDLTGWQGDTKLWHFEDGAIVGQSTEALSQNEFLWSGVEVSNFYLAADIMLEPNTGNAGIQFRSKKVDERGQALGYQGDVGQDVWGRLYHEHGRGKLDWTDEAEKAVKPGQWNHYEILAVGPAIWIAVNGKLGVAYLEPGKDVERTGLVAVQLHAGPPEKARYRFQKLVHNPKIELGGLGAKELVAALRVAGK